MPILRRMSFLDLLARLQDHHGAAFTVRPAGDPAHDLEGDLGSSAEPGMRVRPQLLQGIRAVRVSGDHDEAEPARRELHDLALPDLAASFENEVQPPETPPVA